MYRHSCFGGVFSTAQAMSSGEASTGAGIGLEGRPLPDAEYLAEDSASVRERERLAASSTKRITTRHCWQSAKAEV